MRFHKKLWKRDDTNAVCCDARPGWCVIFGIKNTLAPHHRIACTTHTDSSIQQTGDTIDFQAVASYRKRIFCEVMHGTAIWHGVSRSPAMNTFFARAREIWQFFIRKNIVYAKYANPFLIAQLNIALTDAGFSISKWERNPVRLSFRVSTLTWVPLIE